VLNEWVRHFIDLKLDFKQVAKGPAEEEEAYTHHCLADNCVHFVVFGVTHDLLESISVQLLYLFNFGHDLFTLVYGILFKLFLP
jgi:hypothetical protein